MGLPAGFEGIENDRRLCRWVAGAHVMFLALMVWQVWVVWSLADELDGRQVGFAVVAMVLTLPGTFFFWRISGLGWVLLSLADASALLQTMYNMSRGWSRGEIPSGDLWGALFVLLMLVSLFVPRVFGLFTGVQFRYWGRAHRRLVRIEGEIRLFRGHRADGIITDISASGCSFISSVRVPLGERVSFHPSDGVADIRIRVVRELPLPEMELVHDNGEEKRTYPFCYGGQFVSALTGEWYRRLQAGELPIENPD